MLAKQNRAWEFDLEEGLLDSSKLPRIIMDPYNSLSFKKEKDLDFKDTVVTLLIDNSGSIIGVQVGQKLGERIDSSGLRALLAILLLIVGIAIAYDTFFADEIKNGASKIASADLNFFSKFIKEFSNDMPFFYGLFSILSAVLLGIGAAFIRRFLSNLRKRYFNKMAKKI